MILLGCFFACCECRSKRSIGIGLACRLSATLMLMESTIDLQMLKAARNRWEKIQLEEKEGILRERRCSCCIVNTLQRKIYTNLVAVLVHVQPSLGNEMKCVTALNSTTAL